MESILAGLTEAEPLIIFAAAIFFPRLGRFALLYGRLNRNAVEKVSNYNPAGKPFTVSLYSLGMAAVGHYLMALFGDELSPCPLCTILPENESFPACLRSI